MSRRTSGWSRTARATAAVVLGLGALVPAVSACTSPAENETEQVEQESEESGEGETGDLEESEPESDREE
jgi:hypothetical protein